MTEMDPRSEEPLSRDGWRRLLDQAGADGPPRALDERILREARGAASASPRRWWLPGALAASLLLAVAIGLQMQQEQAGPPEVLSEEAVDAPVTTESAPAAEAPSAEPPVAAPLPRPAPPPPAPAAAPRAAETPAAAATEAPAARAQPAADARLRSEDAATLQAPAAQQPRDPEAWLAEIAALRAAGRDDEADAELVRFEQAWPGWLERQGRTAP